MIPTGTSHVIKEVLGINLIESMLPEGPSCRGSLLVRVQA